MIGTSETVLWTGPLSTMQRILIRIIATIIVAIAKPVWLYANIGLLAFQMIWWTSCVLRTPFMCFIRSDVILAVIHSITNLRHWNAAVIRTRELAIGTIRVLAVLLVGAVFTVVFMVTFPRFEDATSICATEFIGRTRMES